MLDAMTTILRGIKTWACPKFKALWTAIDGLKQQISEHGLPEGGESGDILIKGAEEAMWSPPEPPLVAVCTCDTASDVGVKDIDGAPEDFMPRNGALALIKFAHRDTSAGRLQLRIGQSFGVNVCNTSGTQADPGEIGAGYNLFEYANRSWILLTSTGGQKYKYIKFGSIQDANIFDLNLTGISSPEEIRLLASNWRSTSDTAAPTVVLTLNDVPVGQLPPLFDSNAADGAAQAIISIRKVCGHCEIVSSTSILSSSLLGEDGAETPTALQALSTVQMSTPLQVWSGDVDRLALCCTDTAQAIKAGCEITVEAR